MSKSDFQKDLDALFKEFPCIKDELYWKTWEGMYQCRYDDPTFTKLYKRMEMGDIEYDIDHLPDNLKKFWLELNFDLSKVEYSRLKSQSLYVEPRDKDKKQYYSDLKKFFILRERLEEAEYCVEGGDVDLLQDIED